MRTFEHVAPNVWKKLSEIQRTDWVRRGIENPETVVEHILALIKLAHEFKGLSDAERKELSEMLEIHDWPESIHGDEILLTHEDIYESRAKTKFEKELAAMATLCKSLGQDGEIILSLWLRFETSKDEIASIARQLDKYQAVEKALEYEQGQKIAVFKEFLEYSRKFITHPVLVERLGKLEDTWRQAQ